jgi:hypothetical protein
MKSKLTGGKTELLFAKIVLNKYKVNYYRCLETGFIQTEDPYWLNESYSNVITSLDVGLTNRNLRYAKIVAIIIKKNFISNLKFFDWGGGIGLFVRLMRDMGYDYILYDLYAPNILALGFSLSEIKQDKEFELITAFEVFEHLVNPLQDIEAMLLQGKNILFSTALIPTQNNEIENWWYLLPETGQHIAFYSIETLEYIAAKYQLNLYSNNSDFHLFTKEVFKKNPLLDEEVGFFIKIKNAVKRLNGTDNDYQQRSLIGADYEYILNGLRSKKYNR